jgi:hypothetical protein
MGSRGPRPKHSRTSALQAALAGAADTEKAVKAARRRVPPGPGRKFFDAVAREFTGWSAAELELLVRAGQATTRIEEARGQVARDGITIPGARGGHVRHPALAVERAALAELRALLKDLKLEEAPR